MALITCPECGQQVSDKAKSCIHCGSPIAVDNSVKIKTFLWPASSMVTAKACDLEISLNGSVVWSGLAGSVVTLNVNGKEKIHILAKKVQAKGPFVYSRDINLDFEVEQGKKYEIYMTRVSLLGDLTKGEYALREVDVFDSAN